MAVITLSEVKSLLGISGTDKDALIESLIPIVEADIKEYCNQAFVDSPGTPAWPVWMKIPSAQMIGYQLDPNSAGLKSESQGGYSYTKQDLVGGYPAGVMQSLNKAKMVRARFPSTKGLYRDLRGLTEKQIVTGLEPRGSEDELAEEAP